MTFKYIIGYGAAFTFLILLITLAASSIQTIEQDFTGVTIEQLNSNTSNGSISDLSPGRVVNLTEYPVKRIIKVINSTGNTNLSQGTDWTYNAENRTITLNASAIGGDTTQTVKITYEQADTVHNITNRHLLSSSRLTKRFGTIGSIVGILLIIMALVFLASMAKKN